MSTEKPSGVETREQIGTTPFSVSARVAMQLGRESISSSVTAILELVKNAYDADAGVVRIRFAGLNTATAALVIEDDGNGMSPEELKAKWMVIGTANKAQAKKSGGKRRILTGEKGLGRLGLDRLCSRTRVQTMGRGAAEAVELDVNWQKYEVEGPTRLEEVIHPLFRLDNLKLDPLTGKQRDYPHGTCLVLEELKDSWGEAAIAELHGELSLLISPFSAMQDFRVELDTGGAYSKFDGPVTPDSAVLNNAYWKVAGTIVADGAVEIRMTSKLHETEYHLQPVAWSEFAKGEGPTPRCGPLQFEFYFFHRGELDAPGQTLKLPQLTQFLKSNQGIRIYRDGFRVKPYGEPSGEGDWLRLGFRRTINPEGVKQGANWKLGYNQVVGAVFLSRETNLELIDQTNREGLVRGDAFRHLYIFSEKVLSFFEKNHQKFEVGRSKQKPSSPDAATTATMTVAAADAALKELGELSQKLGSLLPAVPGTAEAPPKGEDVRQSFDRVTQTIARSVKALEESVKQETLLRVQTTREKDTLANLASLGILAACFGHETSGWANSVTTNSLWLDRNLKNHFFMVTPDKEIEILQVLTDIGTDAKRLQTFAGFALGNVRPDKRRQRIFCVKKTALDVFAAFAESLQHQKTIETDLKDVPVGECPIRAYPIDWESIFANLITNAMWAITRHPGDRKIRLTIKETPADFTLTFEDSAFGLEAGTEEQVFDAGFSTRRNNKGEQEGTGMGLYIVKMFVQENSGGTIRAISKGGLGGACFVMTVPRAVEVVKA